MNHPTVCRNGHPYPPEAMTGTRRCALCRAHLATRQREMRAAGRAGHQPGLLAAYHARMATLAAACRDAATTDYDRCWWDCRWHGHWATSLPKPQAARRPERAGVPTQRGLFEEQPA